MAKQQNHKKPEISAETSNSDSFFQNRWFFLLFPLTIFISYALIWQNGLVWDDDPYILLNEAVKNFQLNALLTDFHVGNYHPLTMLTLAVEYWLVQDKPWLYHLNNLLLHSFNTGMVYVLIHKLFKNTYTALITALLFALHPLHVESVAWAAERKDVLYTAFLLLSFYYYLVYRDSQKALHYLLSLGLFILSCFSKGMAVVLPAILIMTDWFLLDHRLVFQKLLQKIPFFIVTLIFAYIATTAQKDAGADASAVISAAYNGFERLRIVAYSFLFYWVKTIWPSNLLPFYPYPQKPGGQLPAIYNMALVGVLVFAMLVYWFGRNRKWLWWAVSFFIIAISTVIQILPVGSAIVADRYYYLSSIGPLFLMAKALEILSKKNIIFKYAGPALCVLFGLLTFFQVPHWKNGYTLFKPAEKVYPEDAMVISNIGWYHLGQKDYKTAKEYLMRADNNGFKNADVCRTIGSMFIDEGQSELAIPYLQRAYEYLPKKSRTDWLMALALSKLGRNTEAIPYAERALAEEPQNLEYSNTMASIYTQAKMPEKAKVLYDKLLVTNPGDPDAKLNQAYNMKLAGDVNGEINALKDLIIQYPEYIPAYRNIGVSLSELGRNTETIEYWKKAAQIDQTGDFEYNIGINLAAQNRIPEAIEWYKKAAKKGKKEAIELLKNNNVAF